MKNIFRCFLLFIAVLLFGCKQEELKAPQEIQTIGATTQLNVSNTRPVAPTNRIIYEMDLLSFTTAGTLNAAAARLVELRSLGIDIVWLMPIHERGDQKFATYPSPYAPKDYYSVWSKYGKMDDFKQFVQRAHALGMEVWLDWVPNHTGVGAVWVIEHPEYYVWENGEIKHPNAYSDVLQLAMKEKVTQDAMIQAMKYWIDEGDIDGFRCDYVSSSEIPADFWKRAIPELKNHKPNKTITIMGEADFADQSRLYGCGFDFDYAWRLNTTLRSQGKAKISQTLKTAINNLYLNSNYKTTLDRMVYLTNHDDNENGKNYWQYMSDNIYLLTVFEFTAYGMPLIYNGQEIGHRAIIYPWEKQTINWASPNKKMQNTIATLCALKHTQAALSHGNESERGEMQILECDNKAILAFLRKKGDSEVLVLLNFGEEATISVKDITPGQYVQWLNSETIETGTTQTEWNIQETTNFLLKTKGYAVFVKK